MGWEYGMDKLTLLCEISEKVLNCLPFSYLRGCKKLGHQGLQPAGVLIHGGATLLPRPLPPSPPQQDLRFWEETWKCYSNQVESNVVVVVSLEYSSSSSFSTAQYS
ncbi:hypothetical protein H6P81_006849 [Aristolochia fimbriata]|uniref:Uncharacterized protein n=1 Tax=Aristolochia fimbriata TaxID=158543 RepID=A0AAV7EYG2_ARIFI|nr:hypothetical protein H6P81_006849 [Aristolochia fimbriata]